ncbi:MAG: hypothetical protein IJN49_02055, partial [Clostridia bacterium]|nr:hypothetical protein [Clostridia bacterium]
PKSLEKIRANAFQSSKALKTIYIPEDSPAIESVRKLAEKAGIAVMTTSAASSNSTVKSTQKSPISTVNGSASPEQLQSEIDNLGKEIASLEGSKKKATGAKFGRVLAIIFIILGVVFALLGEAFFGIFEIIVSILMLIGTSSSIGDAKEHNKKIDGEIQKKRAKLNELQKQNDGK